jgi:predicted transcriptional regulator
MTYKTGSVGEFMRWTRTSPEAMVKLLSPENLKLLHLIATMRPGSVRELAMLVRRKESNLSRTLKKLQQVGIIAFEQGPGRTRAPRLAARRVTLDLDLVGAGSVASVERSATRK